MGLDMYLTKNIDTKNWNFMKDAERFKERKVTLTLAGKPVDVGEVKKIEIEAGYWRKANQIHSWFVNNVQEGNDDCGTYYVSREDIQELLGLVTKVLESSELVAGQIKNGSNYTPETGLKDNYEDGEYIKDATIAQELLPTTDGFFFGGIDYDQYYYEDLKYTKEVLETAIKD